MIKFFRKIRYDLMGKNKTGKYFKYAIGEILLVMIGILLALQVSTWNEKRKQKETLDTIYQITKHDLINDLSQIDAFVENFEVIRQPSFETVLKTKPTKEEWLKNPQYLNVLSGWEDFSINLRGFELLKNQSSLTVNIEQNLASKINLFYNKHIVEINIGTRELSTQFTYNNENLQNYEWYSSYIINNEVNDVIEYISNDPRAKSSIAFYYVLFKVYISELKDFSTHARELILEIDNHLKEN